MDRRIDIAISLVAVIFGIFVILEARTIRSALFTDPIGPRGFFYACGVIFILGGLANIAQRIWAWRLFPTNMIPAEGVEDEPGHAASFLRAMAVAGVSLAYILAFRPLGYLIATPIYILVCLWVLDQRNWLLNIAVAVIFTGIFYYTFAQILGVWLPVGPFTDLFRELGWIIL